MTISETHASTTGIGTTEWSLTTDTAGPDTQTNDACVQVFLDLSALATGDRFRFRIYEKVRATGTQRVVAQHVFANAQARPVWASPTLILLHGWDATLQKLAGVDRSIDISVRELSQSSPGPAQPTISSFTPASGDAGDTITITGTNFNGVSQIKIGTTASSLTIVNDTTITTTVPSGMTPGDYLLHVLTPSFDAVSSTAFHVATFSGNVTLTSDYVASSGVVEFDPNVDTTVTLDNKHFIVDGTATLRMRPNAGKVSTMRWINVNEGAFGVGGGLPLDANDVLTNALFVNDKGLWVLNGAVMDIEGTQKSGWHRAIGALTAGAGTITLDATPTGWAIGDEILIAPTSAVTAPDAFGSGERFTIGAISGPTITLASFGGGPTTLQNNHPQVYELTAEVANLTRNVVFTGGSATQRPHIFILPRQTVNHTLKYMRMRWMGPQASANVLITGRWMLHIHHAHDFLDGMEILGCVAIDGGSHAFVSHDAHDITFRDCVGYNCVGGVFWWDPPPSPSDVSNDSDRQVWDHCLAAYTLFPQGFSDPGTSTSDRQGGFAMGSGSDCEATDCAAWGTQTSFNYPIMIHGGFVWPSAGFTLNAEWTVFDGCVSHNNDCPGLNWWQNAGPSTAFHNTSNFTTYHNADVGVLAGAYTLHVDHTNLRSIGNLKAQVEYHVGSVIAGDPNLWVNTLLDGEGIANTIGIDIKHPTATARDDTRWRDTTIIGCATGKAIEIDAFGNAPRPRRDDFVRTKVGTDLHDLRYLQAPDDIDFISHDPGGRTRVQLQSNASAYQINDNGTKTTIAPFDP